MSFWKSWDSIVGITKGDGLDGRGSISWKDKIFLFSIASRPAVGPTQPPIQWVPWALSPGGKRQGVKLTTHLHLVPRSRMVELYLHSPVCLYGIVLNWLTTWTTLLFFYHVISIFHHNPFHAVREISHLNIFTVVIWVYLVLKVSFIFVIKGTLDITMKMS
jgi:hypothetical protein